MQVEQRGKVIAERYIFYICNRLDTLAKDLCVPPVADSAKYMPAYDGNDRRVYDSHRIGPRHAWRDRASIGRMVSNDLFDALQKADFTGLGFTKYYQI
ncbi:imm11 family protein [Loktanella sp. S4079]|uniref:imm11 family protein n=1 Tax=Loktanella sp. S4079 TaxID=579483 RepID=UPI00406D071F